MEDVSSTFFCLPDTPLPLFEPYTYDLDTSPLVHSLCNNQISPEPNQSFHELTECSIDLEENWPELETDKNITIDDYLPNVTEDHVYITLEDYVSSTGAPTTTDIDIHDTEPTDIQQEQPTPQLPCQPDNTVMNKLKSVLISRQSHRQQPCGLSLDKTCTCACTSIKRMHSYSSHTTCNRECLHVQHKGCFSESKQNTSSLNSALKFPPCFVCGGTASGLHYGVNTCEPCKGFFTRYLRKREEYKCVKNGNCPITNRLRGNCSACRLKKCLSLGMARKNSRLGRYSLSRRMEAITQVNELEKKNIRRQDVEEHPVFNMSKIQQENGHQNTTGVYDDEQAKPTMKASSLQFKTYSVKAPSGFSQKLVKVLVHYMEIIQPYGEDLVTQDQIKHKLMSHYEAYKLKIEMFGNLRSVPKDEYFNLLKGYGIEIDKRMMFLKQSAKEMISVIGRYCNFAKQIPNFKDLSSRDQSNLLKSSRYDFFMILMHNGYLHEQKVFMAHNGVAFHREEVADKFFSRKLVNNVCDMYYRLQKLKLSPEENALLIAISLVFTDRCSLENPQAVEQIQFSLTRLLQKQLEKTCHTSALLRFTKIIDCLTVMRESSELYLQEYNQLCQDEMVIEEVPIMTELLFEDK